MSTTPKQVETPFMTDGELQALTDGQLTSAHGVMLVLKGAAIHILPNRAMRFFDVENEMRRRGMVVPTEFVQQDQDQQIEQQIQAKQLTAPRVTPSDITANIVDTEFVTHVSKGGQVLRWAILTTASGYAVVGKPSVSVSPANDNEQIGREVAYENSRNELWPLMGYALKERLSKFVSPGGDPKLSGMPDRDFRMMYDMLRGRSKDSTVTAKVSDGEVVDFTSAAIFAELAARGCAPIPF